MPNLNELIQSAKEHDACNSAIKQIEKLKDFDEFLAHPSAAEWCYWYATEVIKGPWKPW